jgi:hypothetical protein
MARDVPRAHRPRGDGGVSCIDVSPGTVHIHVSPGTVHVHVSPDTVHVHASPGDHGSCCSDGAAAGARR